MKTVVALAIIAVLMALALWLLLAAGRKAAIWWQVRQLEDAPWKVDEMQVGQATQVIVTRPGCREPYLIGAPVPISLPHWEHEEVMAGLRIEAQDKAESLNRPQLTK